MSKLKGGGGDGEKMAQGPKHLNICSMKVGRSAPAKGQSIPVQIEGDLWKTMVNSTLAIVFLGHTRCSKDQLYLFDIANSHGHNIIIGEQVRGDIEW